MKEIFHGKIVRSRYLTVIPVNHIPYTTKVTTLQMIKSLFHDQFKFKLEMGMEGSVLEPHPVKLNIS